MRRGRGQEKKDKLLSEDKGKKPIEFLDRKPSTGEDFEGEPESSQEKEIMLFKLEAVTSTRKTLEGNTRLVGLKPSPKLIEPKVSFIREKILSNRERKGVLKHIGPSRVVSFIDAYVFRTNFTLSSQREITTNLKVIKPAEEIRGIKNLVFIVNKLNIQRESESIMRQVELQERVETTSGEEGVMELEEKDLFFTWSGSSPYHSRSPKIILNKDEENLPTLKTLQILLRDLYRELEGGEPGAYPIDFIADEPRFPEIEGKIITLDLSEGWEATLEKEVPAIERGGHDIVPKLKEISQNMFTGHLGFLIVNLPPSWWKKSLKLEGIETKLATHLSATKSEDYTPPVLITEPRLNKAEDFWKGIFNYFGISYRKDVDRVAKVEELYNSSIRREDWRRVAVTKRDVSESESDEHYLLKASIVDGFIRQCFQFYRENNPKASYDQFFKDYVLNRSGWIITEKEDGERKSDVFITEEGRDVYDWLRRAMKSYFVPELKESPIKVYIEVETGRSEGSFNFRKLREKINNYEGEFSKLWIVVLPRILFRGWKRANMIKKLVTETGSNERPNLSVPIFDGKKCIGLREVDDNYLRSIYG